MLRVWTDGSDLVIAPNAEEAQQLQRDQFGDGFETKPASEYKIVDDAKYIRIWPDLQRELAPSTCTAARWIILNGYVPSMLATYEQGKRQGKRPAWEVVDEPQDDEQLIR